MLPLERGYEGCSARERERRHSMAIEGTKDAIG